MSKPEPKEVFPKQSETLEPFVLSSFQSFPEEPIYPFLASYDDTEHRMYYLSVDMTPQLQQHCGYVIRKALGQPELCKVNWLTIYETLQKTSATPRNTDRRTGFQVGPHTFIVKKYFTFGMRRVEKATQHVLQLGKTPMLLYLNRGGMTFHNKRLFPNMRQFYAIKLLPHTNYYLPAKTQYILLSLGKTIFSLQILKEDYGLDESFLNPLVETTEPIRIRYALPPPTPRIDDQSPPRMDEETPRWDAPKRNEPPRMDAPQSPVYLYVIAPSDTERMPPPPAQTIAAPRPEPTHSPELEVIQDYPSP